MRLPLSGDLVRGRRRLRGRRVRTAGAEKDGRRDRRDDRRRGHADQPTPAPRRLGRRLLDLDLRLVRHLHRPREVGRDVERGLPCALPLVAFDLGPEEPVHEQREVEGRRAVGAAVEQAVELLLEVGGRAEAVLGALGERAAEKGADVVGQGLVVASQAGRRDRLHPRSGIGRQRRAGQQVVEDRPQGVDVSLPARVAREQRLGGEVGQDRGFGGVADRGQQLVAEAEARDHALAVVGDEDQRRVEQAVHDPRAVDLDCEPGRQGERELLGDEQSVVDRDREALRSHPLEDAAQRLRGNVVVGEGEHAAGERQGDGGGDIGRLQRLIDASRPRGHRGEIGPGGERPVEDPQPGGPPDARRPELAGSVEMAQGIADELLEEQVRGEHTVALGHGCSF